MKGENNVEHLITIIVPVYNGERFIGKCFNSIINQTFKNLEIIIINDGSTDDSSKICDKFAKLDERITVIHQENSGLSAVRNKGLDMAKGDLIGFVDCDDYIHPRMYEILYKHLYDYNADIAMCEVTKVHNSNINGNIRESDKTINQQNIYCLKQEEAFKNLFNEKNLIMVVPWNKLYKKDVFKNIRYPEGKIKDDEFVIHHIIHAIKKIVFTDAIFYYYNHNENSITNKKYNLQNLDAIEAIKDRLLLFELKKYQKLLSKGANSYLHLIIMHYYAVQKYLPIERRVMEKLKRTFREEYKKYKSILNNKNKTELFLFFIHPNFHSGFLRLRKGLSRYLVERRLNKSES